MFRIPPSAAWATIVVLVVLVAWVVAAFVVGRWRPAPQRGPVGLRQSVPFLTTLLVALAALLYVPALVGRISYARTAAQVKALHEGLGKLSQADTVSPLYRAVAEAIKPAVVVIRTSERVVVQQPEPDVQDFLHRFFGEPGESEAPPQYYVREGIGSGIIIDERNGYVLTNRHVIHGAQTAEVILADGRSLQAQWARSDPGTDLALVKIEPQELIAAPLGDSDEVEVGDMVLAVGAPEGLPQTVTSGIISAKGRRTGDGYERFLQTDAAINPGNSGGPLVNMKGEVIGINTAIISPVGVNAGIGLAIPVNEAKRVLKELAGAGT
jgi:serine protease Do